MKVITMVLITVLLSSCAIQWRHPDHHDRNRFDGDAAQCKQYADKMSDPGPDTTVYKNQSAASGGAMGRAVGQIIAFRMWFVRCMEERGYYQYKGKDKPVTQVAEEK